MNVHSSIIPKSQKVETEMFMNWWMDHPIHKDTTDFLKMGGVCVCVCVCVCDLSCFLLGEQIV